MALKPSHGTWAHGKDAYTPVDAARALTWTDPQHPGDWTPVRRTFRDGHTETWWAADAHLGWWGPDGHIRLVVATADPATLPAHRRNLLTGHTRTALQPDRPGARRPPVGTAVLATPSPPGPEPLQSLIRCTVAGNCGRAPVRKHHTHPVRECR
ncbi:hypothetical protein PV342_32535 [Streptomyces sp. PA03-3a]|nr:hypothetical protein [Streptomyces sp. PA03-3a]